MGACLARLWSADALNLAAAALGGGEQLLAACRDAVREAGALQDGLPGRPGPDALRAASSRLADGATEAEQLAMLLGCTAHLQDALVVLLVEDAELRLVAGAHEADSGSENARAMKVVGAVAKSEGLPSLSAKKFPTSAHDGPPVRGPPPPSPSMHEQTLHTQPL